MTDTRSIVIERDLPHPAEKVWRALTRPELVAEWMMRNDFVPTVGHRFNFRAEPGPQWNGVTDCEVLTVRPFEELSYSWNSSGDEAADGLRTTVTWTLTPTDGGVRLRVEQSGFRPRDGNYHRGAGFGWPRMLGMLERMLADPDRVWGSGS